MFAKTIIDSVVVKTTFGDIGMGEPFRYLGEFYIRFYTTASTDGDTYNAVNLKHGTRADIDTETQVELLPNAEIVTDIIQYNE